MAAISGRVISLDAVSIDTGTLRGDILTVLRTMNSRCHAIDSVPDPEGQLASYVRREAALEGLGKMNLVFSQAIQRREIRVEKVSDQISRVPIGLLYSRLALDSTPVSDEDLVAIVDEAVLPLIAAMDTKERGKKPE